MKTKGTKVYEINGTEMRFNREAFNQAILRYNRSLLRRLGK